jgi:hypothetical protein
MKEENKDCLISCIYAALAGVLFGLIALILHGDL